jgi:hypothetical protein
MPPFAKPALAALIAAGAALGFKLEGHTQRPAASARTVLTRAPRLDATSDAQARQMRRATIALARQTGAAARCHPSDPPTRYAACVVPALRRGHRRAHGGDGAKRRDDRRADGAVPRLPARPPNCRGERRRERTPAAGPPSAGLTSEIAETRDLSHA